MTARRGSPALRRGAWAPALLLLAAAASCRSAAYDPPSWVASPPSHPGYLYGIGSYVGALHAEDNQGYAVEQARGMLSRNLKSRVVATTKVRETEATSELDSETLVSTDHVLQNAELVSTWIDHRGRTGRRGTVWVLLRVPRL